MGIPKQYRHATWRNTTPLDEKDSRIGVGFDTTDGETIRLSLDSESARNLAETLIESLSDQRTPDDLGLRVREIVRQELKSQEAATKHAILDMLPLIRERLREA